MIRCFYQSIPYYNHKVLKCKGGIGDQKHEDFYTKYFSKHSGSGSQDNELKEGESYLVVKTDKYLGDRVTLDLKPFVGGSILLNELKSLRKENPNSKLIKEYERIIFGDRLEEEYFINNKYIKCEGE